MSATWVTFFFEGANFLLLAALLGWLFFRPVRAALEKRRSQYEAEQKAAEVARQEAERLLADAQVQRAKLEGSMEELRQRLEREAEAERDRLIAAARAQTQREHETRKQELVAQRRAQTQTLARDAAHAAVQIVVHLLDQMQGPELEQTLLAAACRELEKLRSAGPLAPVVIESVRPLGDDAVDAFVEATGLAAADLTCRLDPELVAGVRVLTAKGLVDLSAAGLAAQAERVLNEKLDREKADDEKPDHEKADHE